MIGRFFGWWIGELLGLLPGRAARALGLGRDRLNVVVAADRAPFALDTAAGRRALGTVALGGELSPAAVERALDGVDLERCDVVVQLAADRALRRSVTLPAPSGVMGQADLRRALEREIERFTPFRAEQVYFLYALDPQPGDGRSVAVELAVAPRKFIDPVVDCLVALGAERRATHVGIVGIAAVLPAGGARETGELPPTQAAIPRGVASALAAMLLFGFTALAAPAVKLYLERQDLAARAAVAEKEAEQIRRMAGEAQRQTAGFAAIIAAKAEAPSIVRVLDRLTALLPDDTYLNQFNVSGHEIEIEGVTRASAALVRALESAPMFEKVAYVAPVTRDPVTGTERFHFSIQYAPQKQAGR
ncbi:MAG: PilN domain-containing protein [Rhodospirillales bacterium]